MFTSNGIPCPEAFTGAEICTEIMVRGFGSMLVIGKIVDLISVLNAARQNNNYWVTFTLPTGVKEGAERIFVAEDIRMIGGSMPLSKVWDQMRQAQAQYEAAQARAEADAGKKPNVVPLPTPPLEPSAQAMDAASQPTQKPDAKKSFAEHGDKRWDELGAHGEMGNEKDPA